MKRYHWQKIEKIIDKALMLHTLKEQEDYIRKACKDNQPLFLEIRFLLRSIHDAERVHYLEEE